MQSMYNFIAAVANHVNTNVLMGIYYSTERNACSVKYPFYTERNACSVKYPFYGTERLFR